MVMTSQPGQVPCSACGRPLAPADVLYTADARAVCAACFAKGDLAATTTRAGKLGVIAAGGIVGLAPFVFSMSESSYSSVNGVVQHAVYRDWFAVVGGVIAAVLGLVGLIGMMRGARKPAFQSALGVAVVALGGFQIARGVGVFWSPPHEASSSSSSTVEVTVPTVNPDDPATCPAGKPCFDLGLKLDKDHQAAKALVAYTRACELGSSGGCQNAGVMWKSGEAGTKDLPRAVAMYQRECDLDASLCTGVGMMYLDGTGTAKDAPHARALFGKACDAGDAAGCVDVAIGYRDGIGLPTDPAKALELFMKACDIDTKRERGEACAEAGENLVQGDGVPHDAKRAVAYFTKACERDDKECYDLGVATERGEGIGADRAAALALYKRACDASSPNACFNLGVLLENGKPADHVGARASWKRSCDSGYLTACADLGALFERGRGGPKDRAAAKALYKQACDGGDKLGCKNQKALK